MSDDELPPPGQDSAYPGTPSLELDSLRKKNQGKAKALGSVGAQVPSTMMLLTRMNTMLRFVFADDPDGRTRFEIAFEEEMGDLFDEALPQARAAMVRSRIIGPNGGGYGNPGGGDPVR